MKQNLIKPYKKFCKKIYMTIYHPYIFLTNRTKNTFIKRGGIIKHSKNIIFGSNISIGYNVRIQFFGNGKLIMDDGVYICNRCTFLVGGSIHLAKNVLVASDVFFASETHSTDPENILCYSEQQLVMGTISIGEGSWIGEKVIILPNVEIGKKCIIGAGSIITHSIPDYCIAVGNPACVIKRYNFEMHCWEKCDE